MSCTCANDVLYLRQQPCTPAPAIPHTCSGNTLHLRRGALHLRRVPLDGLAVAGEFEAVGAVGQEDMVDAEGGVSADGLFGGGEGLSPSG